MKKRRYIYALVICVALVAVALVLTGLRVFSEPSEEDLLTIVKEGTKNTADSIRSGRGKITAHRWAMHKNGGVSESETVYTVVFALDRFKMSAEQTILQNAPGTVEDGKLRIPPGKVLHFQAAYDGNTVTVYYPDENAANILAKDGRAGVEASYWRDISPTACGFYQISSAGGSSTARREMLEGVDYIVVDINQTNSIPGNNFTSKSSHWVVPDKGFTLTRRLVYGHDDVYKENVLFDEMNTEARSYGNGLWGPAKCTRYSYRPTETHEMQKVRSIVITYAPDFEMNAPVGESDLSLTLPSGTKVYNEVLDAQYTVP